MRFLPRLSSISDQVRLVVAVAVVVLIVPLGLLQWNLARLTQEVDELAGLRTTLREAAQQLEINLLKRTLVVMRFSTSGDAEDSDWDGAEAEYLRFRKVFEQQGQAPEVLEGLHRVDVVYADFDQMAKSLIAAKSEWDLQARAVGERLNRAEEQAGVQSTPRSLPPSMATLLAALRERFDNLQADRKRGTRSAPDVIALQSAFRSLDAGVTRVARLRADAVGLADRLDRVLDEVLTDRVDTEFEDSRAAALSSAVWVRRFAVMLIAMLGLAVVGAGALVFQFVGRPLANLEAAMQAVSSERVNVRLPDKGPAEFRTVATRFNEMLVALESSQERLRQLSIRAETLREEERARIAREVHDELGQQLMAVRMICTRFRSPEDVTPQAVIEAQAEAARLLDGTSAAIKRIVSALRPAVLDHLGLPAAVEWAAEEFERHSGIPCHVHVQTDSEFSPTFSTPLFRVLQEALTNVLRHASASSAAVRLSESDNRVVMTVEDDGVGIEEGVERSPSSFGILGMEERMRAIGGRLLVQKRAGGGTRVLAEVPMA